MDLKELQGYKDNYQKMCQQYPDYQEHVLPNGLAVHLFKAHQSAQLQLNKENKPLLVLILPGGGYEFTSFRESHVVAHTFQKLGCAAAVLHYHTKTVEEVRSTKQGLELTPLCDVAYAIDELRHNQQLGFSQHKIVVCGFSAGGHLAASIATLFNHERLLGANKWQGSLRPDGVILGYPVICSKSDVGHAITFECVSGSQDPHKQEFYSLERHVSANTPPCFIFHTADDELVSVQNSIIFAQSLWQQGATAMLEVFPHGKHGMSVAIDEVSLEHDFALADELLASWPQLALSFMRKFV